MPNILYRARDAAGAVAPGFIEAESEAQAVALLKARGFSEIELLESASMAAGHGERAALGGESAAALAAFLVKVRENPGLGTVLGEVARRQKMALALYAGAGVAALLVLHMPVVAALCVLGVLLTFAAPVWKHRHSRTLQRLLKARATGDWDEAERMIARFRASKQPEKVMRTIEVYAAQLAVRRGGGIDEAVAKVQALAPGFAAQPGLLETHLGSIHAAGKDYPGVMAWMRKGIEAAPQDPSKQLDLALMEARVGDLAQAKTILAGLDTEALEAHGRPFLAWTRGLIALREGDAAAAQQHLVEAVGGLLKSPSPAALPALALAGGACALAMMRNGEPDNARRMLGEVAPLLKVHGDPALLGLIEKEVGAV